MEDLYEDIGEMDHITLFFLFVDYDTMDFKEVAQDKRWNDAFDEEIKYVDKNKIRELIPLTKGNKDIGLK